MIQFKQLTIYYKDITQSKIYTNILIEVESMKRKHHEIHAYMN